jgi:hypothetical protein
MKSRPADRQKATVLIFQRNLIEKSLHDFGIYRDQPREFFSVSIAQALKSRSTKSTVGNLIRHTSPLPCPPRVSTSRIEKIPFAAHHPPQSA